MSIKHITFLLSGFLFCTLFSSCNDNNTTTSYGSQSKDAQIYSFSITAPAPISKDSLKRAQDSIRFIQVNKARYAIDQVGSIIYNPDSLPFGTVLSKVKVEAKFNPTYGVAKVEVFTPDSLNGYTWNTTDSVDFSKMPVRFRVTPPSGQGPKMYDINIRIHKIDPDTILWNQMTALPQAGKSKTLLNNNTFYTYLVGGGVVSLYTSPKSSIAWQKQTLTDLPSTVKPESIFISNSVFYAIDEAGNSYSSSDAKKWVKQNNGKNLVSILGVLPAADRKDDLLLIVFKEGTTHYLGTSKNLTSVTVNNELLTDFPSSGVASYTNFSTKASDRMLVLTGGLNSKGTALANTWLIKKGSAGLEMTPFVKKPLFNAAAGMSNFVYDNLLYVLTENQFYTSAYWGEKWQKAPAKQKLDLKISKRSGQTVIVDGENNIWIFGGVSDKGVYLKDVWKGRLNRLIP